MQVSIHIPARVDLSSRMSVQTVSRNTWSCETTSRMPANRWVSHCSSHTSACRSRWFVGCQTKKERQEQCHNTRSYAIITQYTKKNIKHSFNFNCETVPRISKYNYWVPTLQEKARRIDN